MDTDVLALITRRTCRVNNGADRHLFHPSNTGTPAWNKDMVHTTMNGFGHVSFHLVDVIDASDVVTAAAGRWRWLILNLFLILIFLNGKFEEVLLSEFGDVKSAHRVWKFDWIPTFFTEFERNLQVVPLLNITTQLFRDIIDTVSPSCRWLATITGLLISFDYWTAQSLRNRLAASTTTLQNLTNSSKRNSIERWNVYYLVDSSHNSISIPFPSKFVSIERFWRENWV